jgi:hypothetical protein
MLDLLLSLRKRSFVVHFNKSRIQLEITSNDFECNYVPFVNVIP